MAKEEDIKSSLKDYVVTHNNLIIPAITTTAFFVDSLTS